ncbi:MAG: extracellular solute-binding protein, partial [Candidatus Margulisbacteria bacterium]|nr:extracellular solute-binding protein [Candidatus Margulisiibacteriota bacterium]
MKRLLLFLFLFVLILIPVALRVFAAPTTIVIWHAYRGEEKDAIEAVAQNFNKTHKDIQVSLLAVPFDALADKVSASVPRDKGPDLFIYAQDRLGGWIVAGIAEPIEYYLTDSVKARFVPGSLNAFTYKGSIYGLPLSTKGVTLIYNKAMVSEPPKTTDELISLAKSLTDPAKKQYGLAYEIQNYYYHSIWMQGFGARVFDANGDPVLNSPEAIKALQFAIDLQQKEKIVPEEVTNTLVTTLFNEGKAAMVINGPWFRGEIDPAIEYGVALLPVISETGKPAIPFLTVEGIIMSVKSLNKEAAFKVMDYFTNNATSLVFATKGKMISANKSVYLNKE